MLSKFIKKNQYYNIVINFIKENKKLFIFLSLLSFVSSIFQVSMVAFILPILDFIEMNGDVDIGKTYWSVISQFFSFIHLEMNIYTLALLNLLIVFIFQVLDYFRLVYIQYLYPLGMRFIRKDLMKHFLLDDYLKINSFSKSALVTLYAVHAAEYGNLFYRIFVFLSLIIQIVLFTFVLSIINIYLLALIGVYVLVIVAFTLKRGRYAQESGKEIASVNDKILQRVTEALSSIKIIKVFNFEKNIYSQSVNDSDTLLEKNMIVYKIKGMMNFIDTFNFIFLMGLLVISYDYFNLPLSEIVVFLFLLFRLVPLLKSVNVEKIEINARLESALKIKSFIGENSKNIKFIHCKKNKELQNIKLKNIEFSYEKDVVLKQLNLSFEVGNHYAVIGRSGSGKSTLVNVLLGLYKPTSGYIYFYDKAGQDIDIGSTKAFYMSQEPFILNGTVKENLLFGIEDNVNIKDEVFIQALKNVDLWVLFSESQGLKTIIQEDGANLSGGQKQRLALARLFVRHYDLIVLDEHTSAIDKKSIEIINNAVRGIISSIVINITHSDSIVENTDLVIELENGRVKRVSGKNT